MERSKRYALFLLLLIAPLLGSAQKDTVKIKDNFFDPETLVVATGTQVVWIHEGSVVHTTESGDNCSKDGTWDSGNMTNGDVFTHTFNTQGNYPYFCDPHCSGGMTGHIGVSDAMSIEERQKEVTRMKLRPVPFDRNLKIELKGDRSGLQRITVLDITGRTVKSLTGKELSSQGPISLDASEWNSGVYFVKLAHENGNRTEKVIKR